MSSSASLMAASESTASTRARVGGAMVRQAKLQDAVHIFELVNSLSGDGTLLRRSYAEICENVRDFFVAHSEAGIFLGCGALHLYGPHLAEVRSIVVKPEAKGQGAGGRLLIALLEEADQQGVVSVCLFTPAFQDLLHLHFGFRLTADRTTLPDKDLQGLPGVPATLRVRRSGNGARTAAEDRRVRADADRAAGAGQTAGGPHSAPSGRGRPGDRREADAAPKPSLGTLGTGGQGGLRAWVEASSVRV